MTTLRATGRMRAIAASALVVVLGFGLTGCDSLGGGGIVDTIGTLDFETPLVIPPLAVSTTDADGRRVFDLTAERGSSQFIAGTDTTTWGFNGDYLGPTLVARAGEKVVVNVHNELGEVTTVHWHGMHLPAAMDGGPHSLIPAGDTASPAWTIKQNATTLWYHPHLDGDTEHQAAMGLDGLFIVQDDAESALPLPRDYGTDDIPVIVQDVRLGDDGQFDTGVKGYVGTIGDQLLVNGTIAPYQEVTTTVVRLRLLNASTARSYNFSFDDKRTFALIGTDGGLLEQPFDTSSIQLSPGERAEVLVTMVPGETTMLQSLPPDLGLNDTLAERNAGADSFDVLQLRAGQTLTAVGSIPDSLVPMTKLDPHDAAVVRSFTLSDGTINGKKMQMSRVDEVVTLDTTEVWSVSNSMAQPHSFHVHGVQFQILTVNGAPPDAQLAGWKDTIFVPGGDQFRIIMSFTDYADPTVPYMYHCHLLTHEDDGMMGQFVVVEAGQAPALAPDAEMGDMDSMDGMGH